MFITFSQIMDLFLKDIATDELSYFCQVLLVGVMFKHAHHHSHHQRDWNILVMQGLKLTVASSKFAT